MRIVGASRYEPGKMAKGESKIIDAKSCSSSVSSSGEDESASSDSYHDDHHHDEGNAPRGAPLDPDRDSPTSLWRSSKDGGDQSSQVGDSMPPTSLTL